MPAHPTPRGRLAFLILLALMTLTTLTGASQPALAANIYEISDGDEGDPGDGVLKPARDNAASAVTESLTTIPVDGMTGYRLPILILIDARGLPQLLWLAPTAMRDHAAASRVPTGRWHHAR